MILMVTGVILAVVGLALVLTHASGTFTVVCEREGVSSGVAKPGPTRAWARASASGKQLNIVLSLP